MTSDADALLAAILAAPADDAPRLVYADWLEEHEGDVECPICEGERTVTADGPDGGGEVECQHCSGSGRVSNGNAERAEFIRVQCELARTPETREFNRLASHIEWDSLRSREGMRFVAYGRDKIGVLYYQDVNPEWAALRRRERELWDAHWLDWFPDIFDPQQVRRGFVAEIRCTLAAFVGGECGRCEGRGWTWNDTGGNVGRGHCIDCSDTGRTPGIAAELFRRQPVERVVITDAVVHPSGGNDTYYLGNLGTFPAQYWRRLENHRTRSAVLEATSSACVAWGRSLAGFSVEPAAV